MDINGFSHSKQIFLKYIKKIAKDKTLNSPEKFDARLATDTAMWTKWYRGSIPRWSYPQFNPNFLAAEGLILDTKPYKARTKSSHEAHAKGESSSNPAPRRKGKKVQYVTLPKVQQAAEMVLPAVKVGKKGGKVKSPVLVDTSSEHVARDEIEEEVDNWAAYAREERQARRRERREGRGKDVEVGATLVPKVPSAPVRSPTQVHTMRLDSTGRGEVAVDVAWLDLEEVFIEIE